MASTSHEQGAELRKDVREARQATRRAMKQSKSPSEGTALSSPFGLVSAFWSDMDRMVRGLGLPVLFPTGYGTLSPYQQESSASAGERPAMWAPPVEVLTRDGEFVVRAEIPGIDKEHVNVEIREGRAIISGEREEKHEYTDEGVYRSERSYGRFSRAVALPEGANVEQAKATSSDGVLEIVVPMAHPERNVHRLEIKESGAAEQGNGAQHEAERQEAEHQSPRRTPKPARAARHRKGRR